jgi:hypothetical protein
LHETTSPITRVVPSKDVVALGDSVGFLVSQKFRQVIAAGTPLPCVIKKRFRTVRDHQKAISLTPAVKTVEEQLRELPKLRVPVFAGPAGAFWVESTFRVDPDGRCTVFVRAPLGGMHIADMVIQ